MLILIKKLRQQILLLILGIGFTGNVLFMNQIHYFTPYFQVTMLNVGNAMSILITSPLNEVNLLVDAGNE
jgi:hypothetical protein